MRDAVRTAGRVALFGSVMLMFVSVVEGCASLLLSVYPVEKAPARPTLSRYDAELGWVSPPLLALDHAWGRGRHLRTNSRGFRGSEEVAATPREGSVRVVCSGDSFTYGQGVNDQSTWCSQLAVLDPRLETINLGIPGYGVDQAYLRYRRDGAELHEHLHLFAFIGADLTRAGLSEHHGFAKPLLGLEAGGLRVTNVPVPRVQPSVRRAMSQFGGRLQSVPLANAVLRKLVSPGTVWRDPDRAELEPVLREIFREVAALSAARGSRAVFVYLPVEAELDADGPWRSWVGDELARLGEPFVDLTAALRRVPSATSLEYFIPDGALGEGHYTAQGNAWAARAIHEALPAPPTPSQRVTGFSATS
jgi:hypothetical protein